MSTSAKSTPSLQAVIENLMERSSPDMLWLVQRAQETLEDPRESGLIKFGAFLVGSFAIGQGLSDIAHKGSGKPREWIFNSAENLPPREELLTLLIRLGSSNPVSIVKNIYPSTSQRHSARPRFKRHKHGRVKAHLRSATDVRI